MQQLSPFARLVSAVLFAAVCAYTAADLFSLFENGRTETLREITAAENIRLDGIALRSEQLICAEREAPLSVGSGVRIAAGQNLAAPGGEAVESPCSAVFMDSRDGYEALSITEDEFSPDRLNELLALYERGGGTASGAGHVLGRIVKGRKWYFAAWADCGELERGQYAIRFDGFEEKLDCAVVRAFPDGAGRTAVLVRLPIGKNEYLSLRRSGAEIITKEYSGLKISENALSRDGNGGYTVKKITAAGEKDCAADIIYKGGGFYIIAPTDELFPGVKVKPA